jgi:ABC-2 type transport system permease protein
MRRLWALIRKEWLCVARRELVFLVLIQPLVFCLVWGFCASLDLRRVDLVVLDQAHTEESRDVIRALEASGRFVVARFARSMSDVERAMVTGKANAALVMPHDFPTKLRRGQNGALAFMVDGTDPVIATTGLAYGQQTIEAALRPAPTDTAVNAWYNRSLRSLDLLLIGAIVYQLMFFAGYPAQSFLDEKANGTLIPLAASPVTTIELWLSTSLPNAAIAMWGALVQVGLTIYAVGVPFRGDAGLMLGTMALFTFVHMNLGCVYTLCGDRVRLILLCLMINMLFMAVSGFLIPLSYLPEWTQKIAEWVPLTHGLRVFRAIFEKGATMESVGGEIRWMAWFAIGSTPVAWWCVRRLLHANRG